MCTPLLDALDGANAHLQQRLSFAVIAESPPERLRAWGQQRRWNLRLLSSAGSSYNRDYHGQTTGGDTTMLNVFERKEGRVRHFWGTELAHGRSDPGQDNRGLDFLNPFFAMFDVTREGRGDWYTKLTYDL